MAAIFNLAWIFLKIGFIFFGGGYVLIPLLHRIMVEQYQWLTLREFLDGVALSQLTPGPLAMLATFTGFRAGGFMGGLIATIFIFLPGTVLMLFFANRYEKLRDMELMKAALDGILPAVIGLVASAAYNLGTTSLGSPRDFVMLVAGFLILQFTKASPMLVILGAGATGYFLHFS
ncbi:chromate transport protein ChrA, subunit 2, putative [Geotalea daltonii FRC-32]|uniref:Chromate transport protein ChrA, subunit 2, putative n=1 Tax=Geotalea daltonii (strain DSM 22248 / JCM 15807 / FRC-32) TaxID=316067 RepID=B9M852_GEODF|nr:chromate transporter [Geotalea daltonii]ACM20318.1 chromate transport protein ChrA, subunit 2, putative [Geotalea daltonii FRC-32]